MDIKPRVLLVSSGTDSAHVAPLLVNLQYSVTTCHSSEEALAYLRRDPRVHSILLSAALAGDDGLAPLRSLRTACRAAILVMVSAYTSSRFLLEASQAGAHGFLQSPVLAEGLAQVLTMANAHRPFETRREQAGVQAGVHIEDLGDGQFFLAGSPAMLDIVRQVKMLSRADLPVLITGESGVGKEVVAALLHKYSLRASRPILKVNCAALPTDLLESELFGYEAGAFTGAMKAKPGKFELCDKGTVLLDEIGEMSPQLQAKLLHVLQDGSFSRLGARANTKVDVRVIAATNIDIEQAIREKRFREDLYYRLNAFVLRVPPLRERRQEIPYMLREHAERLALQHRLEPVSFSPQLIAAAVQYDWPGNLRELGNFIKRFLIMRDETAALVELESKLCTRPPLVSRPSVPVAQSSAQLAEPGLKSLVRSSKDETEVRIIQEVLDGAKWNRRIAAERLQISYKSLLQKIRYYDLAATI